MSRTLFPMNRTQARFEVNNHLIKRLGRGSSADVYASIPKTTANEILLEYAAGNVTRRKAFNSLRAALQAAKIANTPFTRDGGNFASEIDCLEHLHSGRTHIVRILDSDEQHGWLTLEMLAGGALQALENQAKQEVLFGGVSSLPPAFGWHLIAGLAEAYLELHFGIINGQLLLGSEQYTHGDVFLDNVMLRFPGTFQDYPDYVLTDLGKSQFVAPEDDDDFACSFFKIQADEIETAGTDLKTIISFLAPQDARLSTALKKLTNFDFDDRDVENCNERLSDLLIEVRDEALQRREELYSPLRVDITCNPLKNVVSDEELAAIFPLLR